LRWTHSWPMAWLETATLQTITVQAVGSIIEVGASCRKIQNWEQCKSDRRNVISPFDRAIITKMLKPDGRTHHNSKTKTAAILQFGYQHRHEKKIQHLHCHDSVEVRASHRYRIMVWNQHNPVIYKTIPS
jgi:hypothetical protein